MLEDVHIDTSIMVTTSGCSMALNCADSGMTGPLARSCGIHSHMVVHASTPTAQISQNAMRQDVICATTVPIGTPRIMASVSPI